MTRLRIPIPELPAKCSLSRIAPPRHCDHGVGVGAIDGGKRFSGVATALGVARDVGRAVGDAAGRKAGGSDDVPGVAVATGGADAAVAAGAGAVPRACSATALIGTFWIATFP